MTAHSPPPARVVDNRWPDVEIAAIGEWQPTRQVSVVIPYYQAPEALELTLAALARQTYPRALMQVLVVDDGSNPPLVTPAGYGDLALSVVYQEDRGFGLARARNTGAAAAGGDILVFLDCDMVPEPTWLEAHARWHHAVADAVTQGFRKHVDFDGITSADVDRAAAGGNVGALFAGRVQEQPEWIEQHIVRLDNLTSGADDLFRVVTGGNLGMRKDTFTATGGFDESFTQWGAEDTEFGFRAFTFGALIVPERSALCWHQGLGTLPDEAEKRSLEEQRVRISHLIAERTFRRSVPGRSFRVPTALVRVAVDPDRSVDEVVAVVEEILGNRFHDLVVIVDLTPHHPDQVWLSRQFDGDPRVVVGVSVDPDAWFPHTPVRIDLSPDVKLLDRAVGRILDQLSGIGVLEVMVPGATPLRAMKTRAWRRAARLGADDPVLLACELFGRAEGSWQDLGVRSRVGKGTSRIAPLAALQRWRLKRLGPDSVAGKVLYRFSKVRSPQEAAETIRWLWRAAASRARHTRDPGRRGPIAPPLRFDAMEPPRDGADPVRGVAAMGQVARRIFGESAPMLDGREVGPLERLDLLVVDPTEPIGQAGNTVIELARSAGAAIVGTSPFASADGIATRSALAPSFDPRRWNPRGFVRVNGRRLLASVGGPDSRKWLDALPIDYDAFNEGMNGTRDDEGLVRESRSYLGVADHSSEYRDSSHRVSRIIRMAASGVPVVVDTLSDEDRVLLGADLSDALAAASFQALGHPIERERLSIELRRAAHRAHSFEARRRQLLSAAGIDTPRPKVSVLLVTNRPDFIDHAVSQVQRQTYPHLELVVALHGVAHPVDLVFEGDLHVISVPETVPFGEALNRAVAVSSGSLISKMDDDDWYSPDHLWDLVLAHAYSGATLVGKGAEFVYLAQLDRTIRRFVGGAESNSTTLGGGALLVARHDLDSLGGWRRIPRSVDRALIDDVVARGGTVYRTHGFGYLLHRRPGGHTWDQEDSYFLDQAEARWDGLDLDAAGVG